MPSAFTVEKKIGFEGDALAAIEKHAAEAAIPIKHAATALILRAIEPAGVASHLICEVDAATGVAKVQGYQIGSVADGEGPSYQVETQGFDLASVGASELLDALRERLDQAAMTDDLMRDLAEVTSRAQSAEKRADAAEIKLRLLREALADDGAEA